MNVTTVASSSDSTTAPTRAPVGSGSCVPTESHISLTELSDSYANQSTTSDARGKDGIVSDGCTAESLVTAPVEALPTKESEQPIGWAV